jgi:hypothetical protein
MSSVTGASIYPFINTSKAAGRQIQTTSAPATDVPAAGGTDASKQAAIANIYDEARSSVANHNAKSFLLGLTTEQLSLLQNVNHLGNPVDVNAISEEGAENLLVDRDHRVDLNNDGLTEVGAARLAQFPSSNTPPAVKDAWNAATGGLSEVERVQFSFRFAATTDGIHLKNLPGGESDANESSPDFSSPSFDWTNFFDTFRYDIDTARSRNTPEYSNRLQGFLDRFQTELKIRGVS